MWKKLWEALENNRAWKLYRHGAAFRSLLQSVGIWHYLATGAAVIVGYVTAHLAALPLWGKLIIGLIAAILFLLMIGLMVAAYRVSRHGEAIILDHKDQAPSHNGTVHPLLRYDGVDGQPWFLLTDLSLTINPQLMNISNVQYDIPMAANNVRARIEYTHADGERFVIREAMWLENVGTAEFPNKVHIPSGKTARLCIAMEQQTGPFIVMEDRHNKSGIKVLRPGKWRLHIALTMDNGPCYGATGVFYISDENRIRYESPLAFIMWREDDQAASMLTGGQRSDFPHRPHMRTNASSQG